MLGGRPKIKLKELVEFRKVVGVGISSSVVRLALSVLKLALVLVPVLVRSPGATMDQ